MTQNICNLKANSSEKDTESTKNFETWSRQTGIGECVLLCYSLARACVVSQIFASF